MTKYLSGVIKKLEKDRVLYWDLNVSIEIDECIFIADRSKVFII